MAGQPKKREFLRKLDAIGGDMALVQMIAEGQSQASIADAMDVTRMMITRYISSNKHLRTAIDAAKKIRAEAYAEQSLDIADNCVPEAAAVRKAGLRIDTRKWLAAIDDPNRYGNRPQVAITIGAMHLDALRAFNTDTGEAIDSDTGESGGDPFASLNSLRGGDAFDFSTLDDDDEDGDAPTGKALPSPEDE